MKIKKTSTDFAAMKGRQAITMLTCYDTQTARIIDPLAIDIVLVGDSLGEVIYGDSDTTSVSMDMMERHTLAVRRGLACTHLCADMPIASYDTPDLALGNARRLVEAGADSVKMEKPSSEAALAVIQANIPVCAHVGLTPQTIHDYHIQGRDEKSAELIFNDALRLDKLGCFLILLEAVDAKLVERVQSAVMHPTIGIASGTSLDGQVLVINDLLGFDMKKRAYVKKEADLRA